MPMASPFLKTKSLLRIATFLVYLSVAVCFLVSHHCSAIANTRRVVEPIISVQKAAVLPTFPALNVQKQEEKAQEIPYVIDRIQGLVIDKTFSQISEMCINVFFNNDLPPNASIPPWKALQLAYLRSAQLADLSQRNRVGSAARKNKNKQCNDMFIARRLVPVPPDCAPKSKPLILDEDMTFNVDTNRDVEYVRGEVIGFCEVTERQFGLGEPYDSENGRDTTRPVLTNLSVVKSARKSGIGSNLVDACENAVIQWDENCSRRYNEIILEVEADNPKALNFYEKRGYKSVFDNPASRRFDTSGFVLRRVQCNKICMRKTLDFRRALKENEKVKATLGDLGTNIFGKLNVFQSRS